LSRANTVILFPLKSLYVRPRTLWCPRWCPASFPLCFPPSETWAIPAISSSPYGPAAPGYPAVRPSFSFPPPGVRFPHFPVRHKRSVLFFAPLPPSPAPPASLFTGTVFRSPNFPPVSLIIPVEFFYSWPRPRERFFLFSFQSPSPGLIVCCPTPPVMFLAV